MPIYQITQEDLDATPERDHRWRWPGVTGPGAYTWNEAANCYERHGATKAAATEDEHPHDFDRTGLGIGNLGRYVEEPAVPTIQQIERLEKLEAQAQYCKRCGCSDVFDGAMFTTIAGSGLCDDCCG